jgi:Flp pilus assembly pilin Flp
MLGRLRELFVSEDGQDLIEYGLLSAFIGVCAILAWQNIPPAIAAVYNSWDVSVQDLSRCTPDPGGGGC